LDSKAQNFILQLVHEICMKKSGIYSKEILYEQEIAEQPTAGN